MNDIDNHFYISSGKVNWSILIIVMPFILMGSIVSGLAMYFIIVYGNYYILFTPLIPSILIGTFTCYGLKQSHCRNNLLTYCFCLLVTIIAFLAFYKTEFILENLREMLIKMDEVFNLSKKLMTFSFKSENLEIKQLKHDYFLDLIYVFIYFGIVNISSIPVVSTPYDENQGEWLEPRLLTYDSDDYESLFYFLYDDEIEHIRELQLVDIPKFSSSSYTVLALFYNSTNLDSTAYIAIKLVNYGNSSWKNSLYFMGVGEIILPLTSLTGDELNRLKPLFDAPDAE